MTNNIILGICFLIPEGWLVYDYFENITMFYHDKTWLNEWKDFFIYNFQEIKYTSEYKDNSKLLNRITEPSIDIIKYYHINNQLLAVKLTIWLRLFQLICRKKLKQNKQKRNFNNIKKREIYGKY